MARSQRPRPPGLPPFSLAGRNPGIADSPGARDHLQAVSLSTLSSTRPLSPPPTPGLHCRTNSELTSAEPGWQSTDLNLRMFLGRPGRDQRGVTLGEASLPSLATSPPGGSGIHGAGAPRTPLQRPELQIPGCLSDSAPSLAQPSLRPSLLLPGPCCFGWKRSGGVSKKSGRGSRPARTWKGRKGRGAGRPGEEGSKTGAEPAKTCRAPWGGEAAQGSTQR